MLALFEQVANLGPGVLASHGFPCRVRCLFVASVSGEVVAFLNPEDWYADQGVLADAVSEFDSDAKPQMVYGYVPRTGAEGRGHREVRVNSQA